MITMRNRVTTELRQVEPDSAEFLELQRQRHPGDELPVWEQTSIENALEQVSRANSSALRPEDLGDADQPVERIVSRGNVVEGFVPSSQADRNHPTPGELAQGTGRAAEDYEGDDPNVSTTSSKVEAGEATFDAGDLEGDERLAPGPGFLERDEDEGSSDDLSPESPKADLQAAAESRGLSTSGNRQELYDRIVEHDNSDEDESEDEDEE